MTEIKIAISKRELERIWWDTAANGALVAAEAVKAEINRRLILARANPTEVGSELTWRDIITVDGDEFRVFSWRPAGMGVRGSGGDRRVGWWTRIWRRMEGWLWGKEMK